MKQEESWQPIADTLGFPNESEMLKHLYIEQEFSLAQIKSILGYSTFSIRRRLQRLGVPVRARGGSSNRLGRRKLKYLSNEELSQSPGRLAIKYGVHVSTIFFERRQRIKEIEDAIRQHHANAGNAEVRQSN